MPKVQDVLKFRDGGLSVEEARKKMQEAGETPPGKRVAVPASAAVDALEGDFVDDGQVTRTVNPNADAQAAELQLERQEVPPVPSAPSPAPPPVPPPAAPQPERVETDQFVGEIRQEKGKWVAELRYRSGSGTERFTADSKNELMLELLKGKGHATLRVKDAVRREKLGGPKLDKAYSLPAGITSVDFEKMTDEQKAGLIDEIAEKNAALFRIAHPEYHATAANWAVLDQFLAKNNLPITVTNLEYALEDLTENDQFPDRRPTAAAAEPQAVNTSLTRQPAAPPAGDSAAAAPPAAPGSSPASRAEAQPVVVTRKRGSTGLPAGHSSVPSDAGAPVSAEDGGGTKEPSEAELRKLPMDQLKRIATADRLKRATTR